MHSKSHVGAVFEKQALEPLTDLRAICTAQGLDLSQILNGER